MPGCGGWGLNRRPSTPPIPVQRDEWPRPGDLLHVDIKPLGRIGQVGHRIHGDRRRATRGIGWEYAHVGVDDHSRLAYVEVFGDQLGTTCAAFLGRAVASLQARGITARRVMRDNGGGYLSRAWRATLAVKPSACAISAPEPPRRGPTAKRSVSFRRCFGNRRTPNGTPRPRSAEESCVSICSTTTVSDHSRGSRIRLLRRGSRAVRDEQRG